jgi:hypothetical protein
MTIRRTVAEIVGQWICGVLGSLERRANPIRGYVALGHNPRVDLSVRYQRAAQWNARGVQMSCACVVASYLLCGTAVANDSRRVSLVPISCIIPISPMYRPFEQNINAHIRLIFRQSHGARWFVTSPRPIMDRCGSSGKLSVYSTLEIPSLSIDEWSGGSFDCEDAAKTLRPGMPLIGIFSKSGNVIPTKAISAWTVDINTGKFRKVVDVSCHSFDQ